MTTVVPHRAAPDPGSTPLSTRSTRMGLPVPGQRFRLAAAMVVVLLLWSSAFIGIRVLGGSLSAPTLALGRLTAATVALALLAAWRRPPLPRGRGLVLVAVYGLTWFAGYNVVLNLAEQHLDAGTAAMLVNLAPLIVAVLAGLFLAEGFPPRLVLGITVAFGGIVLITFGGGGARADRLGVALGIASALLYASGILAQKVALRTVDPVTATWVAAAVGTAVLLPAAPGAVTELAAATPSTLAAVAYLGVFPTAVAFTLWAYVLRHSTAGATASATLSVPAITVGMSWLVLGEVPTLAALVGGALALLGVGISRTRSRAARLRVVATDQGSAATP
jgi:drug/metabolite transporter (DMT)-like permease